MNTDDYRYILTIAQEESISRAAEKLFISQPALSQRIKHVRKELGIELFAIDKTGIHLTNAGRCFTRYAQRILLEEENMKRELYEMNNLDSGTLTIGISQMATSSFFKRLITQFHLQYPNVKINIVESPSLELRKLLLNGKIDIGILHMPPTNLLPPELSYEVIADDRLVFIPNSNSTLKNQFFYKESFEIPYILPETLASEPLALPESDTLTYALANIILHAADAKPTINHLSRSYAALSAFADMGLCNCIFLQSYLGKDVLPGDFCYIDTDEQDRIPTVFAYLSNQYIPKILGKLIALAKETWEQTFPYQP